MPLIKTISFSILIALIVSINTSCQKNSKSGIYINEFLASNSGVNTDSIYHAHVDWIEIYNGYDSIIDISGYYLTDKKSDTTKWSIPMGTRINPKEFLIVWADRQDTSLHTNYRLSRSGGQIALYSSDKKLLDYIDYNLQELNVSSGRNGDGVDHWEFYDEPTPGFSNTKSKGVDVLIFSEVPEFSLYAGFYFKDQILSLTSQVNGAEIRYTLDGSIPKRTSKLFENPILIDTTSIIRAIAIEKGKLSSKTITKTYFINVDKDLAVISLVSDPTALWDSVSGIYENSLRGIDRLANIEFFEENNEFINQEVNIKISGNWARFHAQKAILVEANGKYGKETLDHRFFPDKRIYSFRSILLRAGGHPDKYKTMFKDGVGQFITQEHLKVDYQGYRPVVVYLNGKYWGIYNIREKVNANYLVDNYNLAKDQFDFLQTTWLVLKNGDRVHYKLTRDYIKKCKPNPENYAYIKTLINVDNYINYNIAEIYAANVDWPHWNIKFWREYREDALWKWVLVDLDYGFGTGKKVDFNMIEYATSPVETRVSNPPKSTMLLRKMLEFPSFKNEFIQRFAVSLNVVYDQKRVLSIIKQFEDERINEMSLEIKRWADSIYTSPWGKRRVPKSMKVWDDKIETMRDFVRQRPDFVRIHLNKKFQLDGMVDIKTISNGGHITINTIDLDEGYLVGTYFKNLPMRMEAVPNPGQKFLFWIVNGKQVKTSLLNFNPVSNGTIEAVFESDSQTELPSLIIANTTLIQSSSPYYSTSDVVIEKGATLTIEKGVQILMEEHRSIIVYGGLICKGTIENPASIIPNPNTKTTEWGALCIDNATSPIELTHLKLSGGTWYDDKPKYKATITSLNSDISLNYVTVESSHFPFYSEYGTVSIRNSRFTSPKTCDLINVKYATNALVENCDLPGNNYPDTDAIDYDGIDNGVIRNNIIYGFFGLNSDAIDIGEASSDILIEGNQIFNMTDKGVSIGQGSSAIIKNNLFSGCNMGVGIKDEGSYSLIDQNTFYGNKYGVAVFEKNQGAGGGSADIFNSIFSRSKKKPILVDSLSKISVSYSLSDTKRLKGKGNGNITGDPEFENILEFNFKLKNNSPALRSGDKNQDLGANIFVSKIETPKIVINEINISPKGKKGSIAWIELYNNSNEDVDLTGYTIKNENLNSYALPQHLILKKGEYIVLTNELNRFLWHYPDTKNVRRNLNSKLFSNGKALLLYNGHMNLVDYVDYKNMSLWPSDADKSGAAIKLNVSSSDNEKEENWIIEGYKIGSPGMKNNGN